MASQKKKPTAETAALERIWGDGFRVFLSHKAEAKTSATELKTNLSPLGIACFVAHEDILPGREWQSEIERALASMDAFVALMTEDFHDSLWTDQEVGYAFGRRTPIVCVRLGADPYGFIGKFQALSCAWDKVPSEIAKLLMNEPRMVDALIGAVQSCESFSDGNRLAEVLPGFDRVTTNQAAALVVAFNENLEARGSFGLNGYKPNSYGGGLPLHLSRATGRRYEMNDGTLTVTPLKRKRLPAAARRARRPRVKRRSGRATLR